MIIEVWKSLTKEIQELVDYVVGENFWIDEFTHYKEYLMNVVDFSMRNHLVPVETCNELAGILEEIGNEVFEEYRAGNLVNHYEEPEAVYLGTDDDKNRRVFKDEVDKAFEEYVCFMYNPGNSHKCEECPENHGCSSWQGNLPCGQQHCWVDCHCE